MKQMNKGLYKVTTERVVGFTNAVERLGKHEVCGSMVYYRPEHVRMVLQGKQRSVKLLLLIAQKCPEMFAVCKVCDDVKAWYENFKKQEVA